MRLEAFNSVLGKCIWEIPVKNNDTQLVECSSKVDEIQGEKNGQKKIHGEDGYSRS